MGNRVCIYAISETTDPILIKFRITVEYSYNESLVKKLCIK
jgi:hypothetical protein